MLTKDEIDKMAGDLGVGPADVQRDYINGWMLIGIFNRPDLASRLVLKGGNALRKGYFANTRYSMDLDFSTESAVDKAMLKAELEAVTAFVTEKTGVGFVRDRLQVLDNTRVTAMLGEPLEVLEVRAYFLDFYGNAQVVPVRVHMDITQYDKLYLEPESRRLIHPYPDADQCAGQIRCVALEEILASKLKCLLQRQHAPDLYDYLHWLLLEGVAIDQSKILRVFMRKTIYSRAPGVAFELLLNLPQLAFQGLWDKGIVASSSCRLGLDDGFALFKAHLGLLFGQQSAMRRDLSFFPSSLRDPIMSAGRHMHLMSLTYDGVERVVEPYALKYKFKKSGGEGEYFYAYDRTGGQTSAPGLKTFVPGKVQALKELDEKFHPRSEVELYKAGEMPDDPYFHGAGGNSRFIPSFGMTRRKTHTIKYVFHCAVCGKRFRRKERNSDIRGHVSASGERCWSTHGIYDGRS